MGGNSNSQPQVKRTFENKNAPRAPQKQQIVFNEKWVRSITDKLQKINSANKANPVPKEQIVRQIKNLKIEQKLIQNVEKFQLQEIKTNITQKGITITIDFPITNQNEQSIITAAGESPSMCINVSDETQDGLEQGTNAIYKQHCDALNLTLQQGRNLEKVRENFFQLIFKFTQGKNQKDNDNEHKLIIQKKRQNRTKVLLAFQYLVDKIFDTQYTPLEHKIIETIYKGDVKQLEKMIKKKPQILNFRTKGTNYPLLYLASRSGHTDIVEMLIRTGIKLNFEDDKSTPLHIAAICGHYHVVKLLLKYGIPHDIKNSDDDTPIQNANGYTRELLEQAEKDLFYALAKRLISAKLCKTVVNVQNRQTNGEIVIRKILLPCYDQNFNDYVDAFHGTKFQYLESIAKHGLKKPGTKVEDRVIEVNKGNIQEGVEIEGDVNWARKIYVSSSIHYAELYCEQQYVMDEEMGRQTGWMPMVQVKVRKGSYNIFGDTTFSHERVENEPQDLQYQIENDDDVKVVALMMVKRKWLGKFSSEKEKNYNKTKRSMLYNKQEKMVKYISKFLF